MNQQCRYIISLLFFIIGILPLKAQVYDVAENPDSIFGIADSIKLIMDGQLEFEESVEIITDTVIDRVVEDSLLIDSLLIIENDLPELVVKDAFKPSPRRAVIYSAIFPGLGQIYNRKYWKLPIIYGGFVGVSYAVTWNHGHYTDYMASYRSILRNDPEDTEWHNHVPYGMNPDSLDKKWLTDALRDRKNYFRYYRDLSVIIAVGLYGLTIVDAYVDAQLFEFDITPDLSMRIEPAVIQRNDMTSLLAQGYGLRWSVSF